MAKGDHFKVPEGNKNVFENNPREDRIDGNDILLVDVKSEVYRLPIRWHVFRNGPNADVGGMRTFVWDKQAVHFTNNGYAHRHWTQQELRVMAPKLNQVWDRLHVIVETDPLPISERTKLYTPDRSAMRDTPIAEDLEKALATFLQNNEELQELNGALIRERLSSGKSSRSTRNIAEKIAKALNVRGFGSMGKGTQTDSVVAKPNKKPPRKLYPNPTTLEGPSSVWAVPRISKHINLHLNATNDFMPNRGRLTVRSTSTRITQNHISIGKLRKGCIRVQLVVPMTCSPGHRFDLFFEINDWVLASGGTAVGSRLTWKTEVCVVEQAPSMPKPKPGS